MIGVRCQFANGLDVAAQFVGDCHPRQAEPDDQSLQEPPCGPLRFGVLVREYRERRHWRKFPTQPTLRAADWDHDLIKMPLVIRPWAISTDAVCEMSFKAIDPQLDRFPADNYAPLYHQVFNTCRAHSIPLPGGREKCNAPEEEERISGKSYARGMSVNRVGEFLNWRGRRVGGNAQSWSL